MGWAHCWPSAHSPWVCTSISTTNPWDWEVIERMEALDGGSWVPTPVHPAVTAGAEPSAPQRAVGHSEQNPPDKINKSKAKAQHLPRGVGGGRGGGQAGRVRLLPSHMGYCLHMWVIATSRAAIHTRPGGVPTCGTLPVWGLTCLWGGFVAKNPCVWDTPASQKPSS